MMDALDIQLINQCQGGFPVTERPFAQMAEVVGVDEVKQIQAFQRLLESGVLTRFGPLFDAVRMGGGLTLAAMAVPESRYDAVVEQVNALSEVAHNYRRDHQLNMWFVLATETAEGIAQAQEQIRKQTGLQVYDFPKLQEFYIGFWLELDDAGRCRTRPLSMQSYPGLVQLDELDRRIVAATQQGLPLVPKPYREIARLVNEDHRVVMGRIRAMLDSGVIRRMGAVPNHYRLGLKGNGMSVWDVPDDLIEELGRRIGELDFVSHCYERPRHLPLWPYNLFAMVHGHDRTEVSDKVLQIAEILGKHCTQHDVLFSSAILKKTGFRRAA